MIETKNNFHTKTMIWFTLFLTSAVYFIPALLWNSLKNDTWFYISAFIFMLLFSFYLIMPLKNAKIKISRRFSLPDTFGYCLFIFTLCFLYYAVIEKMLDAYNIKDSRYSIFYYINSAYSEINFHAGRFPFSIVNTTGILTALLVPLLEELFFRSYIQDSMKKYYGVWFSISAPAFIVGLRHFSLFAINGQYFCPASYFFAFAAFFGFCFFGYVYEVKNNLLPAVIVHFTANISFLLCFKFFSAVISVC